MRLLALYTLVLIVLASPASLASDLSSGRSQWDSWEIDLQEGYCELQMWHRAVNAPYYPDILFRFHVPIRERDGRPTDPDYKRGELILWLYSYLPNVPKENTPLNRIESVLLDGKEIPKMVTDSPHYRGDIYRFFEARSSEAMDILKSFSEAHYLRDSIDFVLTLSNGVVVQKKVPPGRFFDTQARMLSICMHDDFIH